MSHYCRQAKFPLLSLTHHCLVQLLIQRGFARQVPPLNNPPLDPEQAAKISQQAVENPQEVLENPHKQQPKNILDPQEIPPAESVNPIDPPTASTPSHNLAESSNPTVHIPSDDSEDNLPIAIIKRKRQSKTAFLPKR